MTQVKIKRRLCRRLVDSYDMAQNVIKIDGKEIVVSPSCIAREKGFGGSGMDMTLKSSKDEIRGYHKKLLTHDRGIPTYQLAETVEKCKTVVKEFKVMYTLLVMQLVLALISLIYIPPMYLHVAMDIANIHQRNWAKWSFDSLVKGIMKLQRNQK